MLWIGIVLVAAWLVLWLGFKVAAGIVNLLVVVGLVLLLWGIFRATVHRVGHHRR
jgi:hypothetical protein